MITGFEKYTSELNDYEKNVLLPIIVKGLHHKQGIQNAVTSTQIMRKLKERNFKLSGARLRKIIHYIRVNGLVKNLIASSKGYYISTDQKEIQKYIDSLRQRQKSINQITKALSENI